MFFSSGYYEDFPFVLGFQQFDYEEPRWGFSWYLYC